MSVFQPNLTTRILLGECQRFSLTESQSFLEVGCGSGFITKSLLDGGYVHPHQVWLSDISSEAVDQAITHLGSQVDSNHFRVGSCLTPWQDCRFDLIVSDVAGIANEIAALSSWYAGVPFAAGTDGLENSLSVLYEAKNVLNTGGTLLFPIISLSDIERLQREILAAFEKVRITEPVLWPMPQELVAKSEVIDRLCANGTIRLYRKFGKLLATTQIAVCSK